MIRQLLLVDDEKFLLESLKEGLAEFQDTFETKICFSVDEAIKLSMIYRFDLIITDIKMPGKSGIDLLMHLKKEKFQGKVMAMTAYGNDSIFSKITELGGMRVITKPFDFEWFKKMLLDFFNELKGFSGTIESIDLTSVLQIIHLEKKSVVVKIIINEKHGYLYFDNGDLINAEFDRLTGIEAANRLINMNRGKFSVIKKKKNVERKIKVPFLTFIINLAKESDEKKYNRPQDIDTKRKEIGVSKEIFSPLKMVTGLMCAGIFNHEGTLIIEDSSSSIDIKELGILGLNLYESTITTFKQMQLGRFDFFQVQTDKFIYLFTWLVPKEVYLGAVLDIKGNMAILKHKIKEISTSIEKYVVL